MKIINHCWGKEIILNSGNKVVRLYESHKGLTIDLSQVHDEAWVPYVKTMEKYADRKIKINNNYVLNNIIKFFTNK